MDAVKHGVKTFKFGHGGRRGVPRGLFAPNEVIKSAYIGAMNLFGSAMGSLGTLAMTTTWANFTTRINVVSG